MNRSVTQPRVVALLVSLALACAPASSFAGPSGTAGSTTSSTRARKVVHPAAVVAVPTLANSAKGDDAAFDDPVVRQAAVAALGPYNGSVVALDPNSGRILSIVNQKLAFSSGFIPCSTIKPVIAVAALEESVITRDTMIKVASRTYLNLVEALAHSNNAF